MPVCTKAQRKGLIAVVYTLTLHVIENEEKRNERREEKIKMSGLQIKFQVNKKKEMDKLWNICIADGTLNM